MEKRTLLAVVLSVLVITGFWVVQGIFFPPPEPPPATEQSPVSGVPVVPGDGQPSLSGPSQESPELIAVEEPVPEQTVAINTPLLTVLLSNAGGDITSFKLKDHQDGNDQVEMILSGNQEAHAFTVAFGPMNVQPVRSRFYVNRLSEYSVEFYRDFTMPEGGTFRLTKRYDFKPNEYMFELTLTLDGGHSVSAFNFSGVAYTLGFGPQIGPKFEKLDQYEYRNYYTFTNGKQKQEKASENPIVNHPSWAAIAGKYFAFIAIPYANQYELIFSAKPEPGLASASRLYLTRPGVNGRTEDTYRFYLGPKNQANLGMYNTGNNAFNLRDMELIKVANTSGILTPLENLLKWILTLFYRIAPNYGIAIIFLTLLVKILLFPLTKKSSESTLRMQTLAPKIKEIQEKYKDNPQKMQMEVAEFYKKEGYNPLAGCLPLLLQFPIFIAMYNLFNNHFDLRGAMFIPGWIPDLSLPESVFNFSPVRLPLLGWSDIRLLPFIYVGSQLLFGKVTQTPDQQGNAQMKMMFYAMPIIFFFVLYNVPSGLLLYWIMSNILSLGQQIIINKYIAQKRAGMIPVPKEPVIAPPKKKKKR
ncbi:MAG: membrane protein insertase YidC [Spirochaetaceae bacterium]|jgi:YidC/Oxa1 family membrane protein insertase|nr:membrane protein insertase YidC [Spirochaetaceae bacterium]